MDKHTTGVTRNWCVCDTVDLVYIEIDIYIYIYIYICNVVALGRENRTFGLAARSLQYSTVQYGAEGIGRVEGESNIRQNAC
jgi:hypothetical protein